MRSRRVRGHVQVRAIFSSDPAAHGNMLSHALVTEKGTLGAVQPSIAVEQSKLSEYMRQLVPKQTNVRARKRFDPQLVRAGIQNN